MATRPVRGAAQQVAADRVPAVVRRAQTTRFPAAVKTAWKLKSDRSYEAEFTLKGVGVAVKYDSTGMWLETETDITRQQVPPRLLDSLIRQFPGYRIIETQHLEPRSGPPLFEIHLQNAREVVKAQLDSAGRVISRSSKPVPRGQ
ncbi:MAG TPA: PepSY-like domain-containing protein [Gemmatimonadaceae bacterium]|nr:PepSY-like domain-containing protein [Gemmatimonadaceae bacterium]